MTRKLVTLLGLITAILALAIACAAPAPTPTPTPPTPTSPPPTPTKAPEPAVSQISIGGVGGTIFAAVFLPREATVPVGSTLTWTQDADWGHQVTFLGSEGKLPALAQGQSDRTRPATLKVGETVSYDGSNFIHSGILARDNKISVTFTKEGTYKYLCPIHPGMEGTVKVVAKGQPYTTAPQATAVAKAELDLVLALVKPTEATFTNLFSKKVAQKDGSTLVVVPVGPRNGVPGGFLEIAEFYPKEVKIKKGDTVRWLGFSGHTVTFLPAGQTSPPVAPAPALAVAKPSPDYDGKSLYNSGGIGPTPEGAPGVFELKFPSAGTFNYICIPHFPEGQKGTVIVE